MTDTALTYEQAIAEMETILAQLEDGSLSLEDTLTRYERAEELVVVCNSLLDEAELRLHRLSENAAGEIVRLDDSSES